MSICAPKMFFRENLTVKIRSNLTVTPKRHLLAQKHVIQSIDCQNLSPVGAGCKSRNEVQLRNQNMWHAECSLTLSTLLQCNMNLHYDVVECDYYTWVSRYQKGKTSLDLNEARDDGGFGWTCHQLDHMLIICTLLHIDNHTNTSSLNCYRPDALPDTQPTVSKQWRYDVLECY